jgi:putative ABC transport system substrate-binding protein
MNSRRKLVIALGASALASPFGSFAQQPAKVWRIGYLGQGSGPNASDQAFCEELPRLGYVEGRNLLIEYRWAGGIERLPELAMELARLKVDVIVAQASTPVAAAKRATSTIPIVMAASGDPVGTGLITSLARPGGNITGMSQQSPELAGKRLQLLREIRPKATRIALLALGGTSVVTPIFLDQMRTAARQIGITLVVQEANQAAALAGAFTAMRRERAEGLIVQLSPFATEHIKRIAELAAQHQLPAMYDYRIFVDAGGLMAYGPNQPELYRRAALYVDRIFKGAKPADMPVEQPTKFEMFINLKTAKALGLTIPQAVLLRADDVIR